MATKKTKEKYFHQELIAQLATLSTSGFAFVTALAWNEAIQTFVKDYIQRFYPDQSGFLSKLIYAILITLFAVLITYQLSRIAAKFSSK